jgi:hypothetical protein
MAQGLSGSEQNRIITAIVLLVLGLLLLLWAWGSWVYRTSPPESVSAASGADVGGWNTERLFALGGMLTFTLTALLWGARHVTRLQRRRPGMTCDVSADFHLPEVPVPRKRISRPVADSSRRVGSPKPCGGSTTPEPATRVGSHRATTHSGVAF